MSKEGKEGSLVPGPCVRERARWERVQLGDGCWCFCPSPGPTVCLRTKISLSQAPISLAFSPALLVNAEEKDEKGTKGIIKDILLS